MRIGTSNLLASVALAIVPSVVTGCFYSDDRMPVGPDERVIEPAGQSANALQGRWVHIESTSPDIAGNNGAAYATETVYEFGSDGTATRTVTVRSISGQAIAVDRSLARWHAASSLLTLDFGGSSRLLQVQYAIVYGIEGTRLQLDGVAFVKA